MTQRRSVTVAGSFVDGASVPLLAATLVLAAANLRPAVSSIGPVLRELQADLAMSDTVAGVLTTLPVVCFGVVGLSAARLIRRVDTANALVGVLALVAAGTLIRPLVGGSSLLLLTSLVALVGVALGNVLVPVAVKAWFPDDVGRVTGWYSMALSAGTAIPAALTVPAAHALGGWRPGLAVWALPVVVALVPWAVLWARGRTRRAGLAAARAADPRAGWDGGAAGIAAAGAATSASVMAKVRRNPKAWALTVYFGLQSLEAYAVVGWLPSILQDAGVSPAEAGLLTAVTMGVGAPVSLVLPRIAARSGDQRPWVVVLIVASLTAYVGLLVAPAAAPWLWCVSLGLGLCAFPLALVLLGLRARTATGTAALSSLAQGGGYLLAALGPVAIGAVHDLTGAWVLPLLLLAALLVPKLVSGWIAAAPGTVDG